MTISAQVLAESPVRLWGLTSSERLKRQLREIGGIDWIEAAGSLPASGQVLLLNGHYLFEIRTLKGLLQNPDAVLVSPPEGGAVAALVDARQAAAAADQLRGEKAPAGLRQIGPGDLAAFDEALRSARPPMLERITESRREELENGLYGNAYRGITDLVTKFAWPRPARRLVRWCALLGLSPNMVTSIGLVLVIAACYLFFHGQYWAGLATGWAMTLLDTVDGKLARVTIRSSRFGHLYDHIIDLVHPPFWYIYWGMSLSGLQPVLGLDFSAMCWLLVWAYVIGRLIEGLFSLLGNCSIFTWRPFDAWFRLIVARRNPSLIILTASLLAGRPDLGFLLVVAWHVVSAAVLMLRLAQGGWARLQHGPLSSWLSEQDAATGPHAASFRVFGGTRAAFRS